MRFMTDGVPAGTHMAGCNPDTTPNRRRDRV